MFALIDGRSRRGFGGISPFLTRIASCSSVPPPIECWARWNALDIETPAAELPDDTPGILLQELLAFSNA